jgi:hypothetical protein
MSDLSSFCSGVKMHVISFASITKIHVAVVLDCVDSLGEDRS